MYQPPNSPPPLRLSDSYVNALEPVVGTEGHRKTDADHGENRSSRFRMPSRQFTVASFFSRSDKPSTIKKINNEEKEGTKKGNFAFDRRRQRSVVLDAIMLRNRKKKPNVTLPSLEEGTVRSSLGDCAQCGAEYVQKLFISPVALDSAVGSTHCEKTAKKKNFSLHRESNPFPGYIFPPAVQNAELAVQSPE
jgi:hypothetical protein